MGNHSIIKVLHVRQVLLKIQILLLHLLLKVTKIILQLKFELTNLEILLRLLALALIAIFIRWRKLHHVIEFRWIAADTKLGRKVTARWEVVKVSSDSLTSRGRDSVEFCGWTNNWRLFEAR